MTPTESATPLTWGQFYSASGSFDWSTYPSDTITIPTSPDGPLLSWKKNDFLEILDSGKQNAKRLYANERGSYSAGLKEEVILTYILALSVITASTTLLLYYLADMHPALGAVLSINPVAIFLMPVALLHAYLRSRSLRAYEKMLVENMRRCGNELLQGQRQTIDDVLLQQEEKARLRIVAGIAMCEFANEQEAQLKGNAPSSSTYPPGAPFAPTK